MNIFILTCYFFILAVLCVYGFHRIWITRHYYRHRRNERRPLRVFTEHELPVITVQLPVFNEKFVIERLIDAAAALNYPKAKLEIQVLDDSTDETRELAAKRVTKYREQGFDILHLHREDRTGFKAGALAAGQRTAKGEFFAIFDADFVPPPDILRQTVHYFSDPEVGMVQTRWDHLNRNFSLLTKVQAIMLDAHFVIEHGGRCASGLFFNFNGTAGIWRGAAIADAGGWQHDTLTEDLDLSYRAQLKGWRFLFLPNMTCPSELPISAKAFKSQQHRWAKGSIQVMKKLLPGLWRAQLPWRTKLEATFHLTGNLAYLLMVINCTFFMIPAMMIRQNHSWWEILLVDGPLFLMASVSFVYFYLSSQIAIFGNSKGQRLHIPALMALGIGLGLNNARAVVEGLLGMESGFVRTPKVGMNAEGQWLAAQHKLSYKLPNSVWGWLELSLGLMFTASIVWALAAGVWGSLPFLILFQNGFLYMGFHSLLEDLAQKRIRARIKVSDCRLET